MSFEISFFTDILNALSLSTTFDMAGILEIYSETEHTDPFAGVSLDT